MSFMMIGYSNSHNQDHKSIVCSGTDPQTLQTMISPILCAARTWKQIVCTWMTADFLVATLLKFEKRDGQYLSIVGNTISRVRNTGSLRRYTGKLVGLEVQGDDAMHEVWVDPSKAPNEHIESALPVCFWYSLNGRQVKGNIMKPESQTSDSMFEETLATSFEGYFKQRFGGSAKL
jgi:hypothetical protein